MHSFSVVILIQQIAIVLAVMICVAYADHASSYVHFPNFHGHGHGHDEGRHGHGHDEGHHEEHHEEHHDHHDHHVSKSIGN